MGNFCDKSTETILHEICVQVFLRFSDSSKPSQSISVIYELAWLVGIGKSEENLLKTSCNVAPVTKVAHIFWWRHNNRKQSASPCEHWCGVSCDIPYWNEVMWFTLQGPPPDPAYNFLSDRSRDNRDNFRGDSRGEIRDSGDRKENLRRHPKNYGGEDFHNVKAKMRWEKEKQVCKNKSCV